jgi:hypothetical protein
VSLEGSCVCSVDDTIGFSSCEYICRLCQLVQALSRALGTLLRVHVIFLHEGSASRDGIERDDKCF